MLPSQNQINLLQQLIKSRAFLDEERKATYKFMESYHFNKRNTRKLIEKAYKRVYSKIRYEHYLSELKAEIYVNVISVDVEFSFWLHGFVKNNLEFMKNHTLPIKFNEVQWHENTDYCETNNQIKEYAHIVAYRDGSFDKKAILEGLRTVREYMLEFTYKRLNVPYIKGYIEFDDVYKLFSGTQIEIKILTT